MTLAVRQSVATLMIAVLAMLLVYPIDGPAQQNAASRNAESVQAELNVVLKELERARARVAELTQALEQALARLDTLKEELEDKASAIKALRAELTRAEDALAKAEARAAQLEAASSQVSAKAPGPAPVLAPAPAPVVVPTPVPAPSPPADSLIGEALAALDALPVDPILLGGGLAAIVVLLALTALVRRRREGLEEVMPTRELSGAAVVGNEALDKAITQLMEPSPLDDQTATHTASSLMLQEDTASTPTAQADQAGHNDPLQEANVYIAYERFEQAEATTRQAIEQYPERHQYKLKLLEVFMEANQRAQFDETRDAYAQLFAERPSLGGQAESLKAAFSSAALEPSPGDAAKAGAENADEATTDKVLPGELSSDDSLSGELSFNEMDTLIAQPSPTSGITSAEDNAISTTTSSPQIEFELDLDADTGGALMQLDEDEVETITLTNEFSLQEEIDTHPDSAREYEAVGDVESAQDAPDDVLAFGDETQKTQANIPLEETKPTD